MHKRERLEITLSGEKPDRPPIALWQHFPGDDQRAADHAKALYAYQKQWNFDFVALTPANTYAAVDYGLKDQWVGRLDGTRDILKPLVQRSLDWTELRRLEPTRGSLGQQIETLSLLRDAFGDETPLLMTLPNPLVVAEMLGGRELLLQNMRTHPDRLQTGLNIITDNLLRFVDAIRRSGVAGILYDIQHAAYAIMSENEYQQFGCPYDEKILAALPASWWLNVVQVGGRAPMLKLAAAYSAQVVGWQDRESTIDLAEGRLVVNGAVCGGLGRAHPLHTGMPGEVREQALDAIEQVYGRRLILSANAPLLLTSPRSNIRMARQIVEDTNL